MGGAGVEALAGKGRLEAHPLSLALAVQGGHDHAACPIVAGRVCAREAMNTDHCSYRKGCRGGGGGGRRRGNLGRLLRPLIRLPRLGRRLLHVRHLRLGATLRAALRRLITLELRNKRLIEELGGKGALRAGLARRRGGRRLR